MIESQKYQRRLQEVEAVRWDGTEAHAKEIAAWLPIRSGYQFAWTVNTFAIPSTDWQPTEEVDARFCEAGHIGDAKAVRPVSAEYPGDVLASNGAVVELLSHEAFESLYEPAPSPRPSRGDAWEGLAQEMLGLLRKYVEPEGEGQ
jgi:hypothetical protein